MIYCLATYAVLLVLAAFFYIRNRQLHLNGWIPSQRDYFPEKEYFPWR